MAVQISDEARQFLAVFTAETGVVANDCIVEEAVVFVVPPDDMAHAIGPGGQMVDSLEDQFGRPVIMIEDAEIASAFVANALAPAAVYEVTVEDRDEIRVAVATVDPDDVGVAIGRGGARIKRASRLASRHFGIDEIEITDEHS